MSFNVHSNNFLITYPGVGTTIRKNVLHSGPVNEFNNGQYIIIKTINITVLNAFFGWCNYNPLYLKCNCCSSHKHAEQSKPDWLQATQIPHLCQQAIQSAQQNRTITSYIYLSLSRGKNANLDDLCCLPAFIHSSCSEFSPWSPRIPCSTEGSSFLTSSELGLPPACANRVRCMHRYTGVAADKTGCKKNTDFFSFCPETIPQTSLKTAASLCTIKLTPKGSQLHNDKQSRGASATSSWFHTLKIHRNWRHMAALHCCHSCGQSCWDPKTTVKASSCTSFPKEDNLSFLAMRIHVVIKPALEQLSYPHCNHCMS